MVYDERIALPRIPEATADDPEDVSWALSTAEALWTRGEFTEGLKWLRRAAEAASDAEADARALVLAKAASEITARIRPPTRAAADDTSAPETVNTIPTPPPERARSVPPPLPAAAAKRYSTAPPRPGISSRPQRPEASPPHTEPKQFGVPFSMTPPPPSARTFAEAPSTTRSTADWGAPTHTLTGDDHNLALSSDRDGKAQTTSSLPTEARSTTAAFQAVHVVVWREGRGIHVAPAGTLVPSATVDAMLVSLEPGVDLEAWFSRNSHK
ncbi:MAG: hypothetical protein FWD73_13210 [Polyangiaceae bacterium]|nr:hypothetical protein [Polyangiaceae bacterium]